MVPLPVMEKIYGKNQERLKRTFFSWGCSRWKLQRIWSNLASWWKVREGDTQYMLTPYVMSKKTRTYHPNSWSDKNWQCWSLSKIFHKKGRCQYPGWTGIPKVLCEKCKVHLCFTPKSNCFYSFMCKLFDSIL